MEKTSCHAVKILTLQRIVREIVDTSLKGIYGGNVEDLSARSIFPGLWDARKRGVSVYRYLKQKSQASRHHFDRIRLELIGRSGDENNEPLDLRSGEIITLRGGNNLLPITIAKKLGESIVKGFVTKIVNGDGYYLLSSREGREVCAKRVIFACPAGSVASLIKGLGGGLSSDLFSRFEEKLLSVKRAPLIVVHLGLADSFGVLPDKGFGVLFPRGEPSRLLGVMFNSQLFPHYAPKGNKLLTVCVGGVGGERILEYDDNLITKLVVSILERRLRLSKLEALKVTRWPEAIPQYEVGHWRFAAVIDELEKVVPGIYFVGEERGGVGVADRVAEGMRVAKSICSAEA
jgi:oxygen-dependent protoporphyrinogen oxidase